MPTLLSSLLIHGIYYTRVKSGDFLNQSQLGDSILTDSIDIYTPQRKYFAQTPNNWHIPTHSLSSKYKFSRRFLFHITLQRYSICLVYHSIFCFTIFTIVNIDARLGRVYYATVHRINDTWIKSRNICVGCVLKISSEILGLSNKETMSVKLSIVHSGHLLLCMSWLR